MLPRLSTDAEIDAALARLPGWHRVGGSIQCSYRFPEFAGAVHFTQSIAVVADEMNHHPEWTVRYRNVDILSSTHDAGGITSLDLTLAQRIDALAAEDDGESGRSSQIDG